MPRAAKTEKSGMEKIHPASPTVVDGAENKLHRLKRGNEAGYQPGFNPHFYNV